MELALWLIRECEAAGALDPMAAALQIAACELLPPDETVQVCLNAIPVSRAEVAARDTTSYTRENIAAIDRSRRARILACATGEQLRRGIGDLVLRAEVEAWMELRPRLM